MSFTDDLRRLEAAKAPDEALLAALGRALRNHLRRAELWHTPPSYLGYPECRTWTEAFAEGDAVSAPTLDCYLEAVERRFDALMDQLRQKDNIDGLIHLNIKHFILARQKKNDPVGYSAFKNLEAVLEDLAAAGQVVAERRVNGSLRNGSILRFSAGGTPAGQKQIESALVSGLRWEEALPRQVKIGKGAQRLLRDCLLTLPAAGVAAFQLEDLASVLKERVRQAYAQRNRPPDSEVIPEPRPDLKAHELIRMVRPDPRYEVEIDDLQVLLRRVREAIAVEEVQERTRTGMRRLLDELILFAETDEEVPSWAEFARRLGVRRTTLWDHLERLRALTQRTVESR